MSLNWINVEDFSFYSFLLMERFQIRLMCGNGGSEEWRYNMGISLVYNPAVKWYFTHRCPECAPFVEEITVDIPKGLGPDEIRRAEVFALASVEDFVTYTKPEIMDASCNFIYGWDKSRLFELADFRDKVVLDVGSGSGRLAFAAAAQARQVYASEPVDTLREYLRGKIASEEIRNIRVVDGMAHSLPYPDDTFDIVMSGHVVGDDYDAEIAELTRVVKSGGWLLDCPGEDDRKRPSGGELERRGWEVFHYTSKLGGDVYRCRKQITK
jgi:SAM-dependent methyltransferase